MNSIVPMILMCAPPHLLHHDAEPLSGGDAGRQLQGEERRNTRAAMPG